ncbi:MAG: TrkA C-terminal domain-containing protein [Planctomycetota bacterium]
MGALISLLLILSLSILVTRIASVALAHTGLSREMARFQARSAFTGVGFTTGEAEHITTHPVRRRIVFTLMLLGNAGVVTGITSLLLTFIAPQDGIDAWIKLLLIGGGVAVLWVASTSGWIDRHLSEIISRMLDRFTDFQIRDYESVLHLRSGYRVYELRVDTDDWLAGRTLRSCNLREEGVLVLAVQRSEGTFLGAPQPDTTLHAGDVLIIYGRAEGVRSLDERKRDAKGDSEHESAVGAQRGVVAEEQAADARGAQARQDPSSRTSAGRSGSADGDASPS